MYHLYTTTTARSYRHIDEAVEAALLHIDDALMAGIIYAKAIVCDDEGTILADYHAEDLL